MAKAAPPPKPRAGQPRQPAVAPASPRPGPTEPPAAGPDAAPAVDRWWYQSSYELSSGLEVREDGDTVPGDLLEEVPPAPDAAEDRPPSHKHRKP